LDIIFDIIFEIRRVSDMIPGKSDFFSGLRANNAPLFVGFLWSLPASRAL